MTLSVASPSATAASDYTLLPPPALHSNHSCKFTPRGGGGGGGREQGKNETSSLHQHGPWPATTGRFSAIRPDLHFVALWSLPLLCVTGQNKRKWRAAGWLKFHLPTHFLFLFLRLFWPRFVPYLSAKSIKCNEQQRAVQLDLSHILSLTRNMQTAQKIRTECVCLLEVPDPDKLQCFSHMCSCSTFLIGSHCPEQRGGGCYSSSPDGLTVCRMNTLICHGPYPDTEGVRNVKE